MNDGIRKTIYHLIQMIDNDSDDELSADQEALASNSVGDKVRQNRNELKIVSVCSSILELGQHLKKQKYTPKSV